MAISNILHFPQNRKLAREELIKKLQWHLIQKLLVNWKATDILYE